jgi:hypothetical protein
LLQALDTESRVRNAYLTLQENLKMVRNAYPTSSQNVVHRLVARRRLS